MRRLKLLKNMIRRLLAPTGLTRRPPDQVVWRAGDPNCLERWVDGDRYRMIIHNRLCVAAHFVDAGDIVVAAVVVVNGWDRGVFVNPRLSLLATWQDEDVEQEPLEKIRPHASLPADTLEAHRLAPKESVAAELYFHRETFGAACFVMLINGVFYQFVIAPAQASGAIEGRT